MEIRQGFMFVYIAMLLCNCNASNQILNTSNKESSSLENNSPAFNKEYIIDIHGDSIAAYVLVAKGELKKETAILIKGYPGNDNNFDLAHELRINGLNVILFDHRGAWGSQGKYSYLNCLEDINEIIQNFSEPSISNELRINSQKFTLIGRSFGGGVALISGSQNNQVKKIIAISSVNYGQIMESYKTLKELSSFKNYMKKQIMINHDIEKFLQEMLDNKTEFNITNYKLDLSHKQILIIENTDKNDAWINQLDNIEYRNFISDHNYTSQRKEMINEITKWILND